MKRLFLYLALFLLFCIQSDIQAGLLHRYSFTNGDSGAIDSVGGWNGTLQGGATISGNAVQLNGTGAYVNLPGGLITGYTAVSFEVWFTSTSNDSWTRVWDFGDTNPSTGAGRDCLFFTPRSDSNTFRYAISDADPGYNHENYIETTPTATGVPAYVAITHNSITGEVKLYVNGMLAKSGTFSIPLSSVNNVFSYLGKSTYNPDPLLKGSIDEFRIYDEPLDESVIAQHYIDGPDIAGVYPIVIQETNGSTEVIEGNSTPDTYTVALTSQPTASVALTVDPDEQLDVGSGRGVPAVILFNIPDWNVPQTVTVRAYDDGDFENNPHTGIIKHYISSADPDFNDKSLPSVVVDIWDNECGAWGFFYSDYDFNCFVNFKDVAIFALFWLSQFDNDELEVLASEWLKTTQPYAPGAEHGPVQDSLNPLFIEPNKIVSQIDEKIYGHFLEHIYHSVNGGLWGELVWNRSLEILSGGGNWSIEDDELVQSSLATDVHIEFGDTGWEDYELTLEAKKDGGSEGFLILFRAPDSDNFYWLNLGGWGNIQHAIEKEVSGGRSVVTSYVSGSINTGQWYDIRIRCEGNNFKVWLDDNLLFNYTDASNPHTSGEIGVGTWATAARFRNIVVKDLSNNTLFSGLPDIGQVVPSYWSRYGNGSFYSNTNALNSDYCLQIDNNDGNETGIEQTPFNIIPQQYTGSIWARKSNGAMTAVVRLIDGEDVLGQVVTPALTGSWVEYPFTFTPAQSAENATLQVGVVGTGTAYLDQISMMGQDANATGGYRPDLLQAVADLRPPCIRWPGGCFASLYLWKDGIGPQSQRFKYSAYMWDDQDTNAYGTDEFLRMCEILGIEPIIVINTGRTDSACGGTAQWKLPDLNDYLPYALDWMEYCNGDANTTTWGAERAANGHPAPYNVKYWEIDNETWFMGILNYCDVVNEFAPAMRIKAAELSVPVKLIACGSGGLGSQSWNQTLLDECAENIDYISIHHYEDSSGYQSGPPAFEAFIEALGDIIAASSNPDIKIDASEWNLQTTDWRTGLYAGGLLNGFERTGYVFEIGGPALFLRHQSASGWDNAFINFDHTGWFPAPNYVVMKLWHDHYAPYRINMTGSSGNLNAIAIKSADGSKIYFKVVNPTDQNVPVKLVISETFDADSVSLQLVAPDSLSARNTLANPNAVHAEERYASLNKQIIRFTMPRISAGVVQVNRKQ